MVDKIRRYFGGDFRRVKFCVRQFPCHPRVGVGMQKCDDWNKQDCMFVINI